MEFKRRDQRRGFPRTAATVSPTTAGAHRVRKMRVYARESVAHLWLVEPLGKTLEMYRLENGHWVAASTGNERVRVEPFAAVELKIVRWWLEGCFSLDVLSYGHSFSVVQPSCWMRCVCSSAPMW